MKNTFPGYYPPSESDYKRLWKDALIVLDTNVLLNLYRLPTAARDEFLEVLAHLRERLWIPHQVALEFQRRRFTVIASERKSTEEALESASALVEELKKKVDALQIDKRGLGLAAQPLIDDLERANTKLVDAIGAVHKAQLEIASSDPVRDRLDEILSGHVGKGPSTQVQLDELVAQGEDRYQSRIPPGFADSDKEKNPNEATFIHAHLKYHRKFGDLILWRQLLSHAKTSKVRAVLLVTSDRKEDWWWREQGKTIGPHSELVQEIAREAGVELFWMYSAVQFMEHAQKYTTAKVSEESVVELRQVVHPLPSLMTLLSEPGMELREYPVAETLYEHVDLRFIEERVFAWLKLIEPAELIPNSRGFPDFVARSADSRHGYEVKYLRNFERMIFSPIVVNSILRGYLETKEGRLNAFTMIAVISESTFAAISEAGQQTELQHRVSRLLSRYPIDGIIVGAVLRSGFEPLVWQRRS